MFQVLEYNYNIVYVYCIYVTISEITQHMGFFVKVEFYVRLMSSNLCSSFRPTVRFVVEIHRFDWNRATPPVVENLQSKAVAMHAYGVSAYYV